VIGTSFAIGEELYNQVLAGPVTVRVATTTEIRRDVPTANLLATTKTGRVDRQVVVGAHLDSVPEGPGINDNGSGDSGILEIALQMAELDVAPVNQVRFAWWGAEESGLIGSQFYVDSLTKRQIKNTAVNLNFDMIGSPNYVRFVYDGDASHTASLASAGSGAVEDVFVDYFDSQGLRPSQPRSTAARTTTRSSASGSRPAVSSPARRASRRPSRRPSTAAPPGWPTTPATTRPATPSPTSRATRWTRCPTRRRTPRSRSR
jgi:Zn-dependent M28 family amino/carboxypeptidase